MKQLKKMKNKLLGNCRGRQEDGRSAVDTWDCRGTRSSQARKSRRYRSTTASTAAVRAPSVGTRSVVTGCGDVDGTFTPLDLPNAPPRHSRLVFDRSHTARIINLRWQFGLRTVP